MLNRPAPFGGAEGLSTPPRTRRIGTAVIALGLALIAVLTLLPNPQGIQEAAATPFTCIPCGEFGGVDLILNVLLFLPLGLGLGLRGVSRRRALLLVAATTITVETLQAWWIPGRDASLSDLLTNTLGGGLGIGLASWWPKLIFPAGRSSRRLAFGGLVVWLLVWSAGAVLLQPVPPAPAWWGQLIPKGVGSADYPGRLFTAKVNGRPMPDGMIPDPDGLLPGRVADSAIVEVITAPGGSTAGVASILGIISGRQEEALLMAQVGSDLMLRSRRRAADFRLRDPAVILSGAAGQPGDTVRIRGVARWGALSLRADRGVNTDSTTLHITPGLAWTLILPFEIGLDRLAAPLSWLWVCVLLFPVGYWGHRADLLGTGGGTAWWTAVAIAVPFGLWAVPALAAIGLASVGDAGAAVAGLALGASAAGASGRKGQG